MLCFFFSSRRRHTRLQGDWSSDVCSSDLSNVGAINLTNGTVTLNSASAVSVAGLTMSFGTLNGTAPINLTSSSTWTNGTLGGSGVVSIPSGKTVTITNLTVDGRPISNAGVMNLVG